MVHPEMCPAMVFFPSRIQSGVTTDLRGRPSTCAVYQSLMLCYGLDYSTSLLRKTLWLAVKIYVYGDLYTHKSVRKCNKKNQLERRPTLGPTLSGNCGMRRVIVLLVSLIKFR